MENKNNAQTQLSPAASKLLVVFAVIFVCILSLALLLNLVEMSSLHAREQALEQKIVMLDDQISSNSSIIEYRKTDAYIENYAREYLGLVYKGEDVYTFR